MGEYEQKVIENTMLDQKKSKWSDSIIWIGFIMILGVVLSYTIYTNITEINLINNGNSLETSYNKDSDVIRFTGSDGTSYSSESMLAVAHDGDKITLYYYGNDISHARPVSILGFWFIIYIVLCGLIVICILKSRHSNKITQHYEGGRVW